MKFCLILPSRTPSRVSESEKTTYETFWTLERWRILAFAAFQSNILTILGLFGGNLWLASVSPRRYWAILFRTWIARFVETLFGNVGKYSTIIFCFLEYWFDSSKSFCCTIGSKSTHVCWWSSAKWFWVSSVVFLDQCFSLTARRPLRFYPSIQVPSHQAPFNSSRPFSEQPAKIQMKFNFTGSHTQSFQVYGHYHHWVSI